MLSFLTEFTRKHLKKVRNLSYKINTIAFLAFLYCIKILYDIEKFSNVWLVNREGVAKAITIAEYFIIFYFIIFCFISWYKLTKAAYGCLILFDFLYNNWLTPLKRLFLRMYRWPIDVVIFLGRIFRHIYCPAFCLAFCLAFYAHFWKKVSSIFLKFEIEEVNIILFLYFTFTPSIFIFYLSRKLIPIFSKIVKILLKIIERIHDIILRVFYSLFLIIFIIIQRNFFWIKSRLPSLYTIIVIPLAYKRVSLKWRYLFRLVIPSALKFCKRKDEMVSELNNKIIKYKRQFFYLIKSKLFKNGSKMSLLVLL